MPELLKHLPQVLTRLTGLLYSPARALDSKGHDGLVDPSDKYGPEEGALRPIPSTDWSR